MKRARFIDGAGGPERQRGDALLESLVGVVIASIMGLGLSFTASRMMVSQRYVATQYSVLDQMASSMTNNGLSALCGGSTQASVTVGRSTLALPVPVCATAAITVNTASGAQPVTLPAGVVTSMSFSTPSGNATAQTLIGGSGVMTISE